ncbi:hypothetical protein CUJ88_46135 (plasmid) [Paraburkholderia hospita]|nr:hypothetical protein CUJ88_46135 [Paraburkholderia hospita]
MFQLIQRTMMYSSQTFTRTVIPGHPFNIATPQCAVLDPFNALSDLIDHGKRIGVGRRPDHSTDGRRRTIHKLWMLIQRFKTQSRYTVNGDDELVQTQWYEVQDQELARSVEG